MTRIEVPSRAWWYRYLRWYEGQPSGGKEVVVARYGKRAWEETYQVFDSFVHKAERPLQYVFADHCLLDVFVVDEASRRRVNRLWLTALIDAYSRGIVGIALLYEAPCIESIQSALLHGIWPKRSQRRYGIEEEWVCYGIPEELSLDNAWAHHSESLRELAKAVSHGGVYQQMQLYFRPAYQARYGALIERFFGNLSAQLKQLVPGVIRGSHPREVREAGQEACLLYEDLDRVLHRLIVAYQHTPHQGLGGMTPHEKWLEGLAGSLPVVPTLTEEQRRVFLRLYPGTRVIGQRGVSLFGMHYSSPALGRVQRVDRQGRAVKYQLRYDPQDISQLSLFRGEQWVGDGHAYELRQADGGYRQVSLWEVALARALADKRVGETRDWLAYLNEVERLVEDRSAEKRRIWQQRRQRERADRFISEPDPEEVRRPEHEDYTQLLAEFES